MSQGMFGLVATSQGVALALLPLDRAFPHMHTVKLVPHCTVYSHEYNPTRSEHKHDDGVKSRAS